MKKKNLFYVILFILVCILTGLYIISYAETKKSTGSTAQYLVYENKKFGFTLQFPMSWKGYYIIHESNRNYIEVCFVGKGKVSKNITSGSKKMNGLSMFFIGTEKYVKDRQFLDGVKKIGTSHNVNYYYFTSTDAPILVLIDNVDTNDKEEKAKADADFLKFRQMEKDIVNILKTFKAK